MILVLLALALVAIRVPSVMQPMGADQALYAYVGERILHGDRPYADAWDQKPPAIHYTYAAMRAIWPSDAVVPAADLAAAAAIAAMLFVIGRQFAAPGVGAAAALLFLLLSNPAFTRLAGVRVRAQCETFIALAVTAALYVAVRRAPTPGRFALAGLWLGAAFAFKYNAAVYAAAALVLAAAAGTINGRRAAAFVAGCAALPLGLLALLAGAWKPLYDATIAYNLGYSGETYDGPLHFVTYLFTLAIDRARDDALWTLGGAGCAVLLVAGLWDRRRWLPAVWVATACLAIAINGSRGLPQYFVQAAPALALAAAWGGCIVVEHIRLRFRPPAARLALAAAAALVVVAAWRVNQFPKLLEQTLFDAQYMTGRMPTPAYLDRYADGRKYSARAATDLARLLEQRSARGDRVYVFGFTCAAYVYANRESASKFFWSRPVIAGFNEGVPGYGTAGLLTELVQARPTVVAVQQQDWAPDVADSADWFMQTAPLADWLRTHYLPGDGPDGFDVWFRRD